MSENEELSELYVRPWDFDLFPYFIMPFETGANFHNNKYKLIPQTGVLGHCMFPGTGSRKPI